jgi:hypothetical protein
LPSRSWRGPKPLSWGRSAAEPSEC